MDYPIVAEGCQMAHFLDIPQKLENGEQFCVFDEPKQFAPLF